MISILNIKDLDNIIYEYSQVCIPYQIKHIKTIWEKWWNDIRENGRSIEECDILITRNSVNDKYPEWITNIKQKMKVKRCSNSNLSIQRRCNVNITKLDETDGNIIIDIPNCKNETKIASLVLIPNILYNNTMVFKNSINLKSYALDIFLYIDI